jgi:hypothetical protein
MARTASRCYTPDVAQETHVDADGLPIVRDPRRPISPAARKEIIKNVRISVRSQGDLELACQSSGITLELLERWMAEDAHLEATITKDHADCQATLLEKANNDPSPTQRKTYLEILSRLNKAWAPRSRTTLGSQLQDFLAESERIEPPEVYARWVKRLAKFA